MSKKIGPVTMAVVALLALGACSKSAEPVNTATGSTPGSAATGSSSPGTTERTTETTRPRTGTTQSHSGTTMKASDELQLTDDEQACVNSAITDSPTASSIVGDLSGPLTPAQAGVLGQAVANCVAKPKIADTVVAYLKTQPGGEDITSSQAACLRDQVIALDTNDLGPFIGIIAFAGDSGDKSVSASTISSLNSACGTKLAA
jgi:hypothetical protein